MATEDIPQNHVIVTRAEAKAADLKFFFTGRACKRGHIAQRYVSGSGSCKECAKLQSREWDKNHREQRAAAHRDWYARHPENGRAISRRWRENHPEEAKALSHRQHEKNRASGKSKIWKREWCKKNPERISILRLRYRQKNRKKLVLKAVEWGRRNPEKRKAINSKYGKTHREKLNAAAAKWAKNNPEKRRSIAKAAQHAYRARKRNADGKFRPSDIKRILKQQKNKCAFYSLCGNKIPPYHIDHILALSNGGSNAASNVQLLCAACNAKKSNLDQIEFMQRNGKLL